MSKIIFTDRFTFINQGEARVFEKGDVVSNPSSGLLVASEGTFKAYDNDKPESSPQQVEPKKGKTK